MGMDCLAASYNRLPNGPPRFGVGLARQSGAETQPLGGPHGRRKESNAANLASVVRTEDNNTTPIRGLHTPSSGIGLLALRLVPIHADSSHCLMRRPARSTGQLSPQNEPGRKAHFQAVIVLCHFPAAFFHASSLLPCPGSVGAVDCRNAQISAAPYRPVKTSRKGSSVLTDWMSRPGRLGHDDAAIP